MCNQENKMVDKIFKLIKVGLCILEDFFYMNNKRNLIFYYVHVNPKTFNINLRLNFS